MFNGIIEAVGIIQSITSKSDCIHITITANESFHDVLIGESIAVNGVCLTVTHLSKSTFQVTAVPETLRVTNLGELTEGSFVNLERAMKSQARFSGHYVQGHIDDIGEIIDIKSEGAALLVKISLPASINHYIIDKGYITLDGMSITVIQAARSWFTVTFIPHTQMVTIISHYRIGTKINIEVDMLGKYIEKLLGAQTTCNPTSNALNLH
jgi:riboflavin synthase